MIFCIPLWIIAISELCAPLIGLVPTVGEMFITPLMMGPMMDAIFGSMIPFIEQMAEMGATG